MVLFLEWQPDPLTHLKVKKKCRNLYESGKGQSFDANSEQGTFPQKCEACEPGSMQNLLKCRNLFESEKGSQFQVLK